MFNFTALGVVGVFGIDALEQRVEDLFVGSKSLPSKPAMLELDHEVDEKQSGEVKNIATNQTLKETDGQKKKDVKVKLFEMNLSVFEDSVKEMNEKQPEVSLEMKKTLMLVERSKAEIRKLTQRKEKMLTSASCQHSPSSLTIWNKSSLEAMKYSLIKTSTR
uniref:Uncharacterized protein n=1 Tax=Brassica oleracea var. oleracea TaxID=109376 RepID=A0A0D3DFS5_BRAOL